MSPSGRRSYRPPCLWGVAWQAECGFDDQCDDHCRKKRSPDLLDQNSNMAGPMIDSNEVQSGEQIGDAAIVENRGLVFFRGAVDRQQLIAGQVDSAVKRIRARHSVVGTGQSLP